MSTDQKSVSRIPQASGATGIVGGVIADYDAFNQVCQVIVRGSGKKISCWWLTGALTNFFGIKSTYVPEPGTQVWVLCPDGFSTGVIVGSHPMLPAKGSNFSAQKSVGNEAKRTALTIPHGTKNLTDGNTAAPSINMYGAHPYDVLSGDCVHTNDFGLLLGILKTLMQFKASDLAQIRLSAVDDLVQVISNNFEHFSSFGEFRILNNDGELTMTLEGSHREKEAIGVKDISDSSTAFELTTPNPDGTQSSIKPSGRDQSADAIGLWRLKAFVGYLGDFINVFITSPVDAYGKLSSVNPEAGLAQFSVGTDGLISIRSNQGIGLEKCARIMVPKKLKEAGDPTGDIAGKNYIPGNAVKPQFVWSTKYFGMQALQLRDYSAYLRAYYSVARLMNHKLDWNISSEKDIPPPPIKYDGDGTSIELEDVFATIRILNNGSIILLDPSGNTVFLDNETKCLKLSAPADICLEAGRNVNITAGNDLIMRCRNSADLSVTNGDVRVKAEQNMLLNAHKGGMLIESTMTNQDVTQSNKNKGGEDAQIRGVLIRAPSATVTLYSNTISILSKLGTYIECTSGRIRLMATSILNVTNSWLTTASEAFSSLTFRGGQLAVTGSAIIGGVLEVIGGASKRDGIHWGVNSGMRAPDTTVAKKEFQQSETQAAQQTDAGAGVFTFQFRRTEDYHLVSEFKMIQPPFMGYLTSQQLEVAWVENPMEEEYPYPGKNIFTAENGLIAYNEQCIADADKGLAKDFVSLQNAKPDSGVLLVSLNKNYNVLKIPGVDK